MAELPRYRPLGVSIGSMPSVNFIQTGAAEAQVYDNISKGLNAISDFVYKRAVAEAEIAAVKYGAEIAPSAKDLEEASRTGITIDPDLPDGGREGRRRLTAAGPRCGKGRSQGRLVL